MKKNIISTVILVFLFVGCKKEKEYKVETEELNYYLQCFLTEGEKRGFSFDLKKDGLIMAFADLEKNVAGLCTYSNPVKVEFDREYWSLMETSPNEKDMKEYLVFHELGHGLLYRGHDNDLLENGEWKSVMCGGGNAEDDLSWMVNYNGMRIAYYINELFDPIKTPSPDWSSTNAPDFSNLSYTLLLQEDFDNQETCNFPLSTSPNVTLELQNGNYVFKNNTDSYIPVLLKISGIDNYDSFYYRTSIFFDNTNPSDFRGGIITGNNNNDEFDLDYLMIRKNRASYYGNLLYFFWWTELREKGDVGTEEYNELAIRKKGEKLYFYINDDYVYENDLLSEAHNAFGFIISGNSSFMIEDASIYIESSSDLKQHLVPKIDFIIGDPMEVQSIYQGFQK